MLPLPLAAFTRLLPALLVAQTPRLRDLALAPLLLGPFRRLPLRLGTLLLGRRFGGVACCSARRTVFTSMLNRLASSFFGTPST